MKSRKLPKPVETKLYKSCQTRGADDDVIFQNRVKRNGCVLIPLEVWESHSCVRQEYENGYIVLVSPADINRLENFPELELGKNCIVFYQTRDEWAKYDPQKYNWTVAKERSCNDGLGGQYVARIPATTSNDGNAGKINLGFNTTKLKGAGIRCYEYADSATIENTRIQLKALFLCCYDINDFLIYNEFSQDEIDVLKTQAFLKASHKQLLDYEKLKSSRILDSNNTLICPLCLQRVSAFNFAKLLPQSDGRNVPDLTVTEINLFHIEELKSSCFNHRPYNLGWGHHHCNIVVKDSGITKTLNWMNDIIEINIASGLWKK